MDSFAKQEFLDFLSKNPFFQTLPLITKEEIFSKGKTISLEGGQTLLDFHQRYDGVYFVLQGLLRVFDEKNQAISEIFRDSTFGEAEFFLPPKNSKKVCAVRDSFLFYLPFELFREILEMNAPVLKAICKKIALESYESRIGKAKLSEGKLIAFVPIQGGDIFRVFVKQFAAELERFGKVLYFHSNMLGDFEENKKIIRERLLEWNSWVVLECDPTLSPWTHFCVRQADQIVFLLTSQSSKKITPLETFVFENFEKKFTKKYLVFLHSEKKKISQAHEWLQERSLDLHWHVEMDSSLDVQRVARHLAGKSLGLVLSGGGARGIAQIGILKAFLEKGICFDFVGGTSIGAIFAALYAKGWSFEDLEKEGKTIFTKNFLDYTFPFSALTAGKRVHEKFLEYFGEAWIEDLKIPFFCVSSNLTKKKTQMHTRGLLRDAVRASMSLPGVFPPVWKEGNVLVDGGLFNILPVTLMKEYAKGAHVIAIDTSLEIIPHEIFEPSLSGWTFFWEFLRKKFFRRKHLLKKEKNFLNIFNVLTRIADLKSHTKKREERDFADLCLTPPLEEIHVLDFDKYEKIVSRGYQYAKSQEEKWLAFIGEEKWKP